MKKLLFILSFFISAVSFGQNINLTDGRALGSILNQSSWSNTTGYTVNGVTVSASGGKLSFSSGAGSFTQTLDYNYFSGLDKWHMAMTFECTAKGGSSFGIGMGKRSQNSFGAYNLTARIDCTTGGTSGTLFLNGGSTNVLMNSSAAQFGTQLTFSSNDRVLLTIDRDGYNVVATARNITTNSATIYTTYTYSTAYPSADPFMDNLGTFSVFQFAGANTVDSLSVTSNAIINADFAVVGDSKSQGYEVNRQLDRYGDLLNYNSRPTIILAGGSDRTIETSKQCKEIIALHPKAVLLEIGSNDVRSGAESSATYFARYDSIATALQGAGIQVYHTCLYESSISMAAFLAHIVATYPAANILNTYYPLQATGAVDPGGVHPGSYGDSIIYNAIVQGFNLTAGTSQPVPLIQGSVGNTPEFQTYNSFKASPFNDDGTFAWTSFPFQIRRTASQGVGISFDATTAPTDQKYSQIYTDGTTFHMATITDNLVTVHDFFSMLRSAGVAKRIVMTADTVIVNSNVGTTAPFTFNNALGRFVVNSSLQYAKSPVVTTTGYAAGFGATYYRLPTISANELFTFPTGTNEGLIVELLDSNTNASFHWSVSSALDPSNNAITTLTNGTYYKFIYDGGAWREQSQFSSATTGGANIYNTDGTLTANRTLSAGGFNLSLGASGDKLSALTVNSSAGISLQGQVQYGIYQPGDANITVPNNVSVVELPIITANRTITLPTMVAGSIIHFFNTNTSNANSWSFTNTVVDANGLYNISTIRSGRSVDVLYDGTIFIAKDPAIGYPSQTLFTQTSTVTVANSSATTSLVGTGEGSMTVPANFFSPGKTIRIKIAGVYGLLTATPGNLVVNLKIGSTTIATGTISNFITTAPTNQGFNIVATVTCRVAGSSGTVMTDGIMTYENNSTSLSPRSDIDLNNAGATTTVNTTTSNLIDCTIAWQTANSANTISATVVSLEVLN